ncbi:MAG TPA: glycosyltransferase family 4 protein, partial [Vicinamibacterales bacterium]|nr:glycosyltransferase family 4 protein [Vicinamibacterales bacterium]
PESLAYATDLDAQVARLGLATAVHFEGRRAGGDVKEFLARADVFVAPFVELPNGDKDGISTAILEAMAYGCAIVATDAGSTTEAIDSGDTGIVVPQRDAVQLASAIRTVLSDPALAARLGRNASEKAARQFDVAHCEGLFHERIRTVLARRAS